MRPTTLISFLATSLVLLSQSPAAYAAPIPSQLDSAGEKRWCAWSACRVAEPTSETNTTTTTSQAPDVPSLVTALINALETYRNQYTTSNPAVTDIVNPSGDTTADPTDDKTTTEGSPAVAAVERFAGKAL